MLASSYTGRQALAEFLRGLGPQRGHWYSIILQPGLLGIDENVARAFPPLSKLASIGEEMMRAVLLHCGLLQYRGGSGHSPLMNAWEYFIAEQQLDEVEVSHFTIKKKRGYFIRLGSWNMVSHQRRTPSEIWSASLSGKLRVPRVCTSSISSTLAEVIGTLELTFPPTNSSLKRKSTTYSCSSSESHNSQHSDTDEDQQKDNRTSPVVDCCMNIPNEENFPLLHSIFSTHKGLNLYDRLLNEIVRFSESSEINFKRGNNSKGTLVIIPALRNLNR